MKTAAWYGGTPAIPALGKLRQEILSLRPAQTIVSTKNIDILNL
jgi:hypothetical protein